MQLVEDFNDPCQRGALNYQLQRNIFFVYVYLLFTWFVLLIICFKEIFVFLSRQTIEGN